MNEQIRRRVTDSDDEWQARQEAQESMLHVRWWSVLAIFLAIYGFFFMAIYNLNTRTTVVETSVMYTNKSIDEIKVLAKENNALLQNHMGKDVR
jgi:hypothetical protein